MSDNVECEILIDDALAAARAGQTHYCSPIAQSGSVIQQVPDREWRAVIGQFGNVLSYRIVDAEFPILLQEHERGSRKLFSN